MLKVNIKKVELTSNSDSKIILKNINFVIEPQRIFTIIGANGSGKTTLIKAITGLLNDRIFSVDGEVFFQGKDVLKLSDDELTNLRIKEIKYVFQDPINSFDPLKRLTYYFESSIFKQEKISEVFNKLMLPRKEMMLKLYPFEVSGGMAQRLSLALALLYEPSLLILDEPTSGIDTANSNLLLLMLKEFIQKENRAVLLVTHDLNFAEAASSKAALLSDSKLSEFYDREFFFKNVLTASE